MSATAVAPLAPARLQAIVERILRAAGADGEGAAVVAASLVASDVRGVRSHGVIRVPDYVAGIRRGTIDPAARPRVLSESGPMVALDGCSAFGQVAAGALAGAVAAGARRHGICLGTLAGVAHVGRLGEWVERLAGEGLIALLWCNCGDPGGNVAPFGGASARLGTNPLAYAVPVAGRPPIVADFSTSAVSEGTVRVHRHAGRPLPEGWVIDAGGAPTTDPQALYDGGALLPMGGHKGFALGLLVELLGGGLAGAGCASLGEAAGNGLVLIAIDPAQSACGAGFGERAAAVAEALAAVPAAAPGAGVVLPGEPELASAARVERDGLELPEGTWRELAASASALGVDLDLDH